MPTLENWSLLLTCLDPYKAPECRSYAICGEVHGHENFKDGYLIRTSDIKEVNGKEVVTVNNSRYTLGQPAQQYIDFLKAKDPNYVINPEDPLKQKGW